MKKVLLITLLCFSFFVFYSFAQVEAASEQTLIRFSLQFPPKHHLVRAANLFAKTAGEKSKGSLKVQVYPAAQLYKETQIIQAVTSKSVEIGDILLERWGGVSQLCDVLGSNRYVITGYEVSWKLADGPFGDYMDDLMKKKNWKNIFWSASGVNKGITNTKRPLVHPSDWKGLLVRVSNAPTGELTKLFGASPVLMSGAEAHEAMARKVVDASETTLSSVYDRKYYEVQKYLTIFMDYPSYHMWGVNWKWFQELPQEKQNVLLESARIAEKWDRAEVEKIEKEYIEKLKKLMTTHIQTDEEADEWQKTAQPMADRWLKERGPEGEKLLEIVRKTVREHKASKKK